VRAYLGDFLVCQRTSSPVTCASDVPSRTPAVGEFVILCVISQRAAVCAAAITMPTSEPIAAGSLVPDVVIVDPAKYDSCVVSRLPVESNPGWSTESQANKTCEFDQKDDGNPEIDTSSSAKRSTRTTLADLTAVRIPTYTSSLNMN
jgi:hypothetical protein